MALAAINLIVRIDKGLSWTARPKVVYGESDITAITAVWPAELDGWAKSVEFETAVKVPWLVGGVVVQSATGRVPYTDGMVLPSTLINGKIKRFWFVAVSGGGEVFRSVAAEFPFTEPGITAFDGTPEPIDVIAQATVNEQGHLILTRTDTTVIDAGPVIGPQGDKGDTGAQGIQGVQGPIGPDGLPLEYDWDGTSLGVRVQGDAEYQYVDLKGAKGDTGAQGPAGPNSVSTLTDSAITGIIKGAAGKLAAASPGTDFEVAGAVAAHTGDTEGAHAASAISVLDTAGYFTGTDAEAVLAELGLNSRGVVVADVTLDGAWVAGASADAGADTITVVSATGLANGKPIEFRANTGALPGGITDYLNGAKGVGDGDYFNIINLSGTTFQICATVGGTTPVDITSAGTAGWQWRIAGATSLAATGLSLDTHSDYDIYVLAAAAKLTTAGAIINARFNPSTYAQFSYICHGATNYWGQTAFSPSGALTQKFSLMAALIKVRKLAGGVAALNVTEKSMDTADRVTPTARAAYALPAYVSYTPQDITALNIYPANAAIGLIRNGSRIIVVRRGA